MKKTMEKIVNWETISTFLAIFMIVTSIAACNELKKFWFWFLACTVYTVQYMLEQVQTLNLLTIDFIPEFKGAVSRDLQTLFFFINRTHLGP